METIATPLLWMAFAASVLVALWVDFAGLKSRGKDGVTFRSALNWSLVWFGLALAFGGLLWWELSGVLGRELANERTLEYFTGYLVEKSLAVDNVFIFLLIFAFLQIVFFIWLLCFPNGVDHL